GSTDSFRSIPAPPPAQRSPAPPVQGNAPAFLTLSPCHLPRGQVRGDGRGFAGGGQGRPKGERGAHRRAPTPPGAGSIGAPGTGGRKGRGMPARRGGARVRG